MDSGLEPGANASPLFKEPAARITQHDGWACSRVGWTIPEVPGRPYSIVDRQPNGVSCISRSGTNRARNRSLSILRYSTEGGT